MKSTRFAFGLALLSLMSACGNRENQAPASHPAPPSVANNLSAASIPVPPTLARTWQTIRSSCGSVQRPLLHNTQIVMDLSQSRVRLAEQNCDITSAVQLSLDSQNRLRLRQTGIITFSETCSPADTANFQAELNAILNFDFTYEMSGSGLILTTQQPVPCPGLNQPGVLSYVFEETTLRTIDFNRRWENFRNEFRSRSEEMRREFERRSEEMRRSFQEAAEQMRQEAERTFMEMRDRLPRN